MLDPILRPWIDPPLDRMAGLAAHSGVTADGMTIAGFLLGLAVVPLLAFELYVAALGVILANRLADGLDGAIARRTGGTDLGGYLDIVLDMIFYAACVVGFALARPENQLASVVLLASFMGTGSSFLAWAIVAATRRLSSERHGKKSFFYSFGLIEGAETILFLILCCLWPSGYIALAWMFAGLCFLTAFLRVCGAFSAFSRGS